MVFNFRSGPQEVGVRSPVKMLGGNTQRKEEAQNFFGEVERKSRGEPAGKVGQLKWSLGVQPFSTLYFPDEKYIVIRIP